MSVQNITAGLNASLHTIGSRFYLPGASEFAKQLNLGEIIKGKVLRHYEGSRYQVDFNGHQRVVDSSIPLRTGEIIQGRVVAIGEQVELQRIAGPETTEVKAVEAGAQTNVGRAGAALFGQNERLLEEVFARFQGRMDESARADLLRAMRSVPDARQMAMAGLTVAKMGLAQSPELLHALYSTLSRPGNAAGAFAHEISPAQVEAVAGAMTGLQAEGVRQLAEFLQLGLRERSSQPDKALGDAAGEPRSGVLNDAAHGLGPRALPDALSDDAGQRGGSNHLAQWVLNAQLNGMVAHRLGTIPLLLGERLVEVDIALFEQRREGQEKESAIPEARHRQIVFALKLERLGRVELLARLAGGRVSVEVGAETSEATSQLAAYIAELKAMLEHAGWTVDQVSYKTRHGGNGSGAVHAVVEHIVSQDSLNRLI